jgi:hypothetical protein
MASERLAGFVKGEVAIGKSSPLQSQWQVCADLRPPSTRPLRIAISTSPLESSDERMRIIEADLLLSPSCDQAAARSLVPAVFADDAIVLDPSGIVPYRLSGYELVVWYATCEPRLQELVARARATELCLYVVVIGNLRAFAVDPDGVIVAGTFDGYDLAWFHFDGSRTAATEVAPGTDIVNALTRVLETRARDGLPTGALVPPQPEPPTPDRRATRALPWQP